MRHSTAAGQILFLLNLLAPALWAEETGRVAPAPLRIGVLSKAETPAENTSQGLYIRILKEAGMEAGAVSAEQVKAGALAKLDIFIIGGGNGTAFSQSLGPDGGAKVEVFVKEGGGVLASCAGGYAFARGYNEATRSMDIANAVCIDMEDQRWARGKANVRVLPAAGGLVLPPLTMHYANGPLWKITAEPGFGQTVALAHYGTDVKKGGDPGGIMPGTPAILAGTFGDGRYVLFSSHPEFYEKLGNHPMITDAARWVVRRKLGLKEQIDYRSVFPSMLPAGVKRN